MRLSDLVGKEIVNLHSGARLGTVADSDLIVDEDTGAVESIILPARGNFASFWGGDKESMIIPWDSIVKIGAELIIVDLDETYPQRRSRPYAY